MGLRKATELEEWMKRMGLFEERIVPEELSKGKRMMEWVEGIKDFKIKD